MKPGFNTPGFQAYQDSLESDVFNKLIACVKQLNYKIAEDISLGEGFCIGHSYFLWFNTRDSQHPNFIIHCRI